MRRLLFALGMGLLWTLLFTIAMALILLLIAYPALGALYVFLAIAGYYYFEEWT